MEIGLTDGLNVGYKKREKLRMTAGLGSWVDCSSLTLDGEGYGEADLLGRLKRMRLLVPFCPGEV